MPTRIKRKYHKVPRSIWALGIVSMFMDISSELIHSLLPLFMVGTLGASVATVGFIEGFAEATAQITKIFSGALSDYLGKRKLLALIGYGMAACSKPLFPLTSSIPTVIAARFLDRIGKGIRGAPRDALIGDITPPDVRGEAFGLRQSLDTIGAVVGPLMAMGCMVWFADDIRSVLWVGVIPAFIAVAVLALGVEEPEIKTSKSERTAVNLRNIHAIGRPYWVMVAIASALTLARFSEAFLILKAQGLHLPLAMAPVVMVVMNVVYASSAYPVGKLSDRMDRNSIIVLGIILLIAADLLLGVADNTWMLAAGVVLWGLHMAFTQGLFAAMVADTAPAALRGTAYGVYNFSCGVALLAASIIAGELWEHYGAQATFFCGAAFAACSLAGLLWSRRAR